MFFIGQFTNFYGSLQLPSYEVLNAIPINTSKKSVRKKYAANRENFYKKLKQTFAGNGVDHARIKTNEDYIKPLLKLFKKR